MNRREFLRRIFLAGVGVLVAKAMSPVRVEAEPAEILNLVLHTSGNIGIGPPEPQRILHIRDGMDSLITVATPQSRTR